MRLSQRLCFLILCAFATALAHAQLPAAPEAQTGSINGTVTDINDDAVPHANIVLAGQTPADDRTATSDANGFFEMTDLRPGTYHITISNKGFSSWTSEALTLKPGQDLDVPDISLQIATATSDVNVYYTRHDIATQQVHVAEEQRMIGIVPNFYVIYSPNPAPLSAGQKFSLAWHSAYDPTNFIFTGIAAGIQQGVDGVPEWGQDWPGYGQRYGAAFAGDITDLFITGDILPTLFHQDPRYYYKGTGSLKSRALYAMVTNTVVCKGDNGHWQPNYSNVLGTFISAGITNFYYPPAYRGAELTINDSLINVGSGAAFGLLQEFVLRKFTTHSHAAQP